MYVKVILATDTVVVSDESI